MFRLHDFLSDLNNGTFYQVGLGQPGLADQIIQRARHGRRNFHRKAPLLADGLCDLENLIHLLRGFGQALNGRFASRGTMQVIHQQPFPEFRRCLRIDPEARKIQRFQISRRKHGFDRYVGALADGFDGQGRLGWNGNDLSADVTGANQNFPGDTRSIAERYIPVGEGRRNLSVRFADAPASVAKIVQLHKSPMDADEPSVLFDEIELDVPVVSFEHMDGGGSVAVVRARGVMSAVAFPDDASDLTGGNGACQ